MLGFPENPASAGQGFIMSMILTYAFAGVLVQGLVTVALFFWARRVARRRDGVWWRRATWLPLAGFGLSLLGVLVSTVYLVSAFKAVANADPSMKASLLASNISDAMSYTAFLVLPSWLVYGVSVVVSATGTMKKRPRPASST